MVDDSVASVGGGSGSFRYCLDSVGRICAFVFREVVK